MKPDSTGTGKFLETPALGTGPPSVKSRYELSSSGLKPRAPLVKRMASAGASKASVSCTMRTSSVIPPPQKGTTVGLPEGTPDGRLVGPEVGPLLGVSLGP